MFIITLLLLSADFYYLKNIAGRRLVGLRWWNEVNTSSGDSHWVFESSDPNSRTIAATDKRFFWLSLYVAPALWVGLAILAIIKLQNVIWLSLVGEYLDTSPGNRFLEGFTILILHSHCTCLDHHQHARLLAVRQVQPGVHLREQGVGRIDREQPCGGSAGQALQIGGLCMWDYQRLSHDRAAFPSFALLF